MTITVANTANTNTFDYWRNRTNELADAMTNKTVTVDSNTATGNAAITGTFSANVLFLGNTTVNSTSNSTSIVFGNTVQNTVVNTSSITFGNTVQNTVVNTSSITFGNTVQNTVVNTSSITFGNTVQNTVVNTSSITFGNTVQNTVVNTSYITFGNTVQNTVVNTSSITFGNTVQNTVVNTSSIFISNSTSNLTISIPTTSQYANGKFFLNANGSFTSVEALIKGNIETSGITNTEINNYLTNTFASAEYLLAVKDNNANNYQSSKILITHDVDNAYLSEYAIIVSNNYVGSFFANSNTSHVRLYFNPTSTNTTINFTRVEA